MKILVTGGNGFIGNYLLRHLLKKDVGVVSFDRKQPPPQFADLADRVRFVTGEILNPYDLVQAIKNERPDRIVHLAGVGQMICQANPALGYEVNIMGARNVLEAARVMGIERVVYASSASAYGNVSAERLTEDAPKNPTTVYGMTKLAVEHLGFTYAENWGLDFVAVRPCYGMGMYRTGGFLKLTNLIEQVLRGIPIRTKGGDQTYEMVHASDTGKAFALAATKDQVMNKAFHIGSGRRISFFDFVDMVRREIPDADIEVEPGMDRGGSDRTRTLQPPMDLSRARQEGWEPDYTPEMAVKELIDNLRKAMSSGANA